MKQYILKRELQYGKAKTIGNSISEGDHEFESIVAVAHLHPHEDLENC